MGTRPSGKGSAGGVYAPIKVSTALTQSPVITFVFISPIWFKPASLQTVTARVCGEPITVKFSFQFTLETNRISNQRLFPISVLFWLLLNTDANSVVLGIFLRNRRPDIVTRKLSLATTLIVQSTLLKAEGIRIREKGESAGNKTV